MDFEKYIQNNLLGQYMYDRHTVKSRMADAMKAAYNQAIEDAAENVKLETGAAFGNFINKQSILNLKKP